LLIGLAVGSLLLTAVLLLLLAALAVFLALTFRKRKNGDSGIVPQIAEHLGRQRISPGSPSHEMDVELGQLQADRFSVRLGTLSGLDDAEDEVSV
jgi:hypothetical protein